MQLASESDSAECPSIDRLPICSLTHQLRNVTTILLFSKIHLRASRHSGTGMFVADTSACVPIMFLHNSKHSAQESLLLDDCPWRSAKACYTKKGLKLTLMCKPFAFLNEYWLGSQCHEVASDHKRGIFVSEEKRYFVGGWVLLTWVMYGCCR